MIKIRQAKYLAEWKFTVEFSTGETGVLDLQELVHRPGEMVTPLRDAAVFRQFYLELGALSWPNGFDLSPGAVHREMAQRGLLRKASAA